MQRQLLTATAVALFALPTGLLAQERTTIGGYGEVHYTNSTGPDTPGKASVKRFVVYLAHAFSDRLSFRSELEVEDAKIEAGKAGGEVALEQAYLDYAITGAFTLRAGLVLPPVGIVNETHEPPTFNGVSRPAFDHDVIPTTWREIGVGAVGRIESVEGLSYRLYLVNGLRAEGFSGEEGLRGGRQEGQEASFANPSLTGRVEWVRPGLRLGGSFWFGGTSDQDAALGNDAFSAPVTLLSADARYSAGPFALRGVAATIGVRDAGAINARFGEDAGSRISGGYVEAAYDLLGVLAPSSDHRLDVFLRHERFDTHASVPAGVQRDPSYARRYSTAGLSWKPTYNTVFKGDVQIRRHRAGVDPTEVFSLAVGYHF